MSKRHKRYIVVDESGPPCPRCQSPMQVRQHDRITEKHLRQPFFYDRWYCCMRGSCRTTLVMPPEHRVWRTEPEPELQPELSLGDDIALDVLKEMGR
jgi:hypothetical protein